MNTKTLVTKIETLSNGLSPEQLTTFLDILDQMALMVEQAHALPASSKENPIAQSESSLVAQLH